MATVEQRQSRAMAKALGISYTSALRQVREAYLEVKTHKHDDRGEDAEEATYSNDEYGRLIDYWTED